VKTQSAIVEPENYVDAPDICFFETFHQTTQRTTIFFSFREPSTYRYEVWHVSEKREATDSKAVRRPEFMASAMPFG